MARKGQPGSGNPCNLRWQMLEPFDQWDIQPFGKLKPIPYTARFSLAEYETIKKGFIPNCMEDKWVIFFAAHSLFLHRSWTGAAVYRVDFSERSNTFNVKNAYVDEAVCQKDNSAYDAALLSFLIDNILLSRSSPFPMIEANRNLPAGAYQHHIAGTGYRETSFKPPRPWWRFWGRDN